MRSKRLSEKKGMIGEEVIEVGGEDTRNRMRKRSLMKVKRRKIEFDIRRLQLTPSMHQWILHYGKRIRYTNVNTSFTTM